MKVAVVILNYNGKKFLEEFLPNVIANCDPVYTEVVVADNASTDDSVAFMREHFPCIRLIENGSNGGFATGYNVALRQVEADYYVLLNSDIEVAPNWIEPVIAMMDADPQIAACQPKILSYYDKEKFEYAGASGGYIDKYGYPFCRGRVFQNLETDEHQYDEPKEVFWATGACMFVRANLYHQVGGLDDSFGRQFLCPHGGDRLVLAAEECGLQGVLLSAVVGLSHRRRHLAQKLTSQDIPEFPQQPLAAGEESAQTPCEAHHSLPRFS